MYITLIPGVLENNHKNNFSVITNSLPKLNKLTEEQTARNDNNELGTRAI